jgi:flavin reductase (DIM6/NTAB) family NADH-FMN oxidoreductase RutF
MAAADAHTYEPRQGHGLRHDPFNAIVGPRPIGWISTADGAGARNLAPYSFFNAFNYTPPIIGFSSIGWKDTVANIQATGDFVWNLATDDLAEAMNRTAAPAPHGRDEFILSGLTAVDSRRVKAPRVLESPVNFECRLTQMLRLETAAGAALDTWVVFGEVVAAHIEASLIVDGVYQAAAARPVLRWGGAGDYIHVAPENLFRMARPTRID